MTDDDYKAEAPFSNIPHALRTILRKAPPPPSIGTMGYPLGASRLERLGALFAIGLGGKT